jgi:hypothetical protein
MSPESVIEKVQKLLAHAESPACTEAERNAFVAQAQGLMQKHAIEEADLEAHKPKDQQKLPVMVRTQIWDDYIKPRMLMFHKIAMANRCKLVYGSAGTKDGSPCLNIYLFGMSEDIEYTRYLYRSLKTQMERDITKQYRGDKAFKQSFILGFADAVYHRLLNANRKIEEEIKKAAPEAIQNFGLMTVTREKQIEGLVKAEMGPTRKGGGCSSSSGIGRSAGYSSGQKASISKGAIN